MVLIDSAGKVLKRIEYEAKEGYLPVVGRQKGQLLEKLVLENKPERILELGTLIGFSAILMARHLKKGKITCIELSEENALIAGKNINDAGLSDKIEILVGDAEKILPELKQKFGLVFLDTEKEDYIKHLKLFEKNLSKDSVVVADNVKKFAVKVKGYLDYVRNSGKYSSEYFDFGSDAMEVSFKK